MSDPIDDLLNRSAPVLVDRGRDQPAALRQMALDAKDTVCPTVPRRRRTGLFAAALTGALIAGGGGVAVAAGLVDWPAGFEDPDSSFAFTLPSGRACEVRLVLADVDSNVPSGENRAQREIDDWLKGMNLEGELDLTAGELEARSILHEQGLVGMTISLSADGWLQDAPLKGDAPTVDDAYALAVDRAVRNEISQHLSSAGIPANEWTFGVDGGIKCAAE